jgi:hypothetical protein
MRGGMPQPNLRDVIEGEGRGRGGMRGGQPRRGEEEGHRDMIDHERRAPPMRARGSGRGGFDMP